MNFGELLSQLRIEAGYKNTSMLAKKLGVSRAYLSEIEKGIRAAPSDAIILQLVDTLKPSEEQAALFFDLAAKSKSVFTIPLDLVEYISGDENILAFLRAARDKDMTAKDLLAILDKQQNLKNE